MNLQNVNASNRYSLTPSRPAVFKMQGWVMLNVSTHQRILFGTVIILYFTQDIKGQM
jgi:hypothetical protein